MVLTRSGNNTTRTTGSKTTGSKKGKTGKKVVKASSPVLTPIKGGGFNIVLPVGTKSSNGSELYTASNNVSSSIFADILAAGSPPATPLNQGIRVNLDRLLRQKDRYNEMRASSSPLPCNTLFL